MKSKTDFKLDNRQMISLVQHRKIRGQSRRCAKTCLGQCASRCTACLVRFNNRLHTDDYHNASSGMFIKANTSLWIHAKDKADGGIKETGAIPPAPWESLTGRRSRGLVEPGTRSCLPCSRCHGNEGGWWIYDNAGTRTWEQPCSLEAGAAWGMQFGAEKLESPFKNLSRPQWVYSVTCNSSINEEWRFH